MPFARINDIDMFYEDTGEGFPIIWCHEFAGDYRSWEPQVRYFSRIYRNVTFNFRGWMPSTVPTDPSAYSNDQFIADVLGLMDYLKIDKAHLAGLSMGANVVLNFAIKHPDRCSGIVVAGCGTGSFNRERFEKDVEQIVGTLMKDGTEELAKFYTRGPARQPYLRKDPRGWLEFHEQFRGHSALGSALTWQEVIFKRPTIFQLKEKLNQLIVPTLLVVGDEDEPCVEPAVFMKREIPSAGLLMLPQSGHTINLEDPAAFNEAALNFFHLVEAGRWAVRKEVSSSMLPQEVRE